MSIQVHKFGGASVKDAEHIKNVMNIIRGMNKQTKIVVVSAIGKMTNALEKVVEAYFEKPGQSIPLLQSIKKDHQQIIDELFKNGKEVSNLLNDLFVEVEWLLEDDPTNEFNYCYDQIVSLGELASSMILNAYLKESGLNACWQDVRDVIKTDESYREAKVKWDQTKNAVTLKLKPKLKANAVLVTQGFIGSTDYNETTSLGREGSDFTAAILAYCLEAESVSIWKDVPGILTADPKIFENVTKIDQMTYREAIEMTYYGAKVIHPKTIKPIENKKIPLYVRSFKDVGAKGTLIADDDLTLSYPPVIVIEPQQALVQILTKDFSFVAVEHLKDIFGIFDHLGIKVNMMRNTAISFTACIGDLFDKLKKLEQSLKNDFKVVFTHNVELITIRHYNKETLDEMRRDKVILLEEKTDQTIQMVVQQVPLMKRKAK